MATHTNIKIKNRFDSYDQLYDKLKLTEFQLIQSEAKCHELYSELDNIFKAAVEHKKIQITSGKKTITLVLEEE